MGNKYTKTYTISTGVNDGYVVHDTLTLYNSEYSLLIGYDAYNETGDNCDSYIGFNNVIIPKNSTILSAVLKFNVYRCYDGYVNTQLKISTNYIIPNTYMQFDSMIGTTNYISFNQSEIYTESFTQLDIKALIQEVINRSDWISGNNLVVFSTNTTKEVNTATIDIDSYEFDPSVELVITYEEPEVITLESLFKKNRLEFFEYELLTIQNGEYKHSEYITDKIIDCRVTTDFTRNVITNCMIQMNDYSTINFLSDLIKPWYCMIVDGNTYKFPLGQFMLLSPRKDSDSINIVRYITGYDLSYALEQDKIIESISFNSGDNVVEAIETLLNSVGTWVKYSIEPSIETFAEDVSYELGRSKLYIINTLLSTINYYPLWCNGEGVFKGIPWSSKPNITYEFIDDENSIYEPGIQLTEDYTQMYNRVVIINNQLEADTEPLYKVLTFEDINLSSHPFSYTNILRYVTKKVYSEATSQALVDSLAEKELLKLLEIEQSINYDHAFVSSRLTDGLPWQGDGFKFRNNKLDIDYDYKIEKHQIYLVPGTTIKSTIKRVNNIV